MNNPEFENSNENADQMKSEPEDVKYMASNENEEKFKTEIDIKNMPTTVEMKKEGDLTNEQSPKSDTGKVEPETPTSKGAEKVKKEEQTFTLAQYNISLMKAILGTGSLAIPFALQFIGVVPLVIIYIIFALWNVYSSWQLTQLKKHMDLHPSFQKSISVSCLYAKISYHYLGKFGYYLFLCFFLLTLWGFQVGILIIMVNFLNTSVQLFFPGSNTRLFVHLLVSVVLLLTLLLSNLKILVFLSSFGLFALAFSFIVVFIYGFSNFPFSLPQELLFPQDLSKFFSNLGIIVFSLAYMPVFLSLYTRINPNQKEHGIRGTLFSVLLVTFLYLLIGIVLCGLFHNSPEGVKDVIIDNLPSDALYTVLVNLCMCLTLLGNFPVYYISIAEVLETFKGPITSNSVVITHPWYIAVRTIQLIVFSIIGYVYPKFSDILSLYILSSVCSPPLLLPSFSYWVDSAMSPSPSSFLPFSTLLPSTPSPRPP